MLRISLRPFPFDLGKFLTILRAISWPLESAKLWLCQNQKEASSVANSWVWRLLQMRRLIPTQGAILMPQLGGSVKPWNWATIFSDFIILVRMVTIAAAHVERYMESWAYFQVARSLDEMAGGSGNSTYSTSNLQKMGRIQRFKCGRSTHLSHVVKWKFFDLLISVVILLMGCELFRCCDCLHTIQKDFYLLVDIIPAVVKWRFDYWILKLLWLVSNDYWDFLCKSKLLQYCCDVDHATLKALLLGRF